MGVDSWVKARSIGRVLRVDPATDSRADQPQAEGDQRVAGGEEVLEGLRAFRGPQAIDPLIVLGAIACV